MRALWIPAGGHRPTPQCRYLLGRRARRVGLQRLRAGVDVHNRRYPAARGGTQRIAVAAAQRTRELSPAAGAWECDSRRHGSVQRWRRETSVPWVGALSVAGFALDGWCRVGVFLAGVYLDTFGLYLRRLGHHDLQHAVLRRGLDAGRRAADHGAQGAGGTGQTYPGTRQPETRQPGTNHRGRNQQLTTRPPRELTSPAATAGLSRGGGRRTPKRPQQGTAPGCAGQQQPLCAASHLAQLGIDGCEIYTRAQSLEADASGPATEEIPALGCGPVSASRYP